MPIDWRNQWRRLLDPEPRIEITEIGDMTPLGRGDGQWWVHGPSIPAGAVCYSVGVGFDVSFDLDLISQFGATVHAFDPTPLALEWIGKQPVPPGFHFHPVGLGHRDGIAKFVLPVHHGVSYTAINYGNSKAVAECPVATLQTLMKDLGHDRIDLLKLDIEGGEYDVIDDVIAARVPQVLVEFHHRMLGRGGNARTTDAARQLTSAGYRAIHRSPRGLEYVFLRS